MNYDELENLINKQRYTAEDKMALRNAADAAGIKYTLRKDCKSCYEKIALALYERLREDSCHAVSADGFRFQKAGDSFKINGEIWNEATLAGRLVGVLPVSVIALYFEKVREDL